MFSGTDEWVAESRSDLEIMLAPIPIPGHPSWAAWTGGIDLSSPTETAAAFT